MKLQTLYHWFYCLPISRMLLLLACGCGAMLLLRNRCCALRCWRWLCGAGLAAWAAVVIHMTLLSRVPEPGLANSLRLLDSYRIWLREGNREILRSNFMNLGLFLPGGLLLIQLMPRRWTRRKRFLSALTLAAAFSIAIERMQYITLLGQMEADDVLHNGLGAALGILADLAVPLKKTDV